MGVDLLGSVSGCLFYTTKRRDSKRGIGRGLFRKCFKSKIYVGDFDGILVGVEV